MIELKRGIDIDDTLINLSEIYYADMQKWCLEVEGINVNEESFLSKVITKSIHEHDKWWNKKVNKDVLTIKWRLGAKEVIDILLKEGHEVYVITARSNDSVNNFINKTKRWLKKRKINYTGIYFNAGNKKDIMKSLQLDLMIDDSIGVLESAKELNIKGIIMNSYYNTNYDGNPRAYTWYDIYHYIKRINKV